MKNIIELCEPNGYFTPSLETSVDEVPDYLDELTLKLPEMKSGSSLAFRSLNLSIGVNEILPGWDHLLGYDGEEKALENLKAEVSRNQSILFKTGLFGETILHWALLMHSKLAAKWLIDNHGWLRDKTLGIDNDIENPPNPRYKGEGCMHIIIVNRNFDMALHLLQSYHRKKTKTYEMGDFERRRTGNYGYPLNEQRAVGKFFEKTGDNSLYYGETALDFAVSTNQINMVDLLMGYSESTIEGKGKFNGKWRACMRLRDSIHQNSIFHLCALKGHTDMWFILTDHLMDTVANLSNLDPWEPAVKLEVQRRVGTLVNKYGLTPMQVAAYKNDKNMVEVILNQIRLKIWKWGEEGLYAYPLNEIDEYFKCPEETPGIPINNIILCEGNTELVGITLIKKLMKQKWLKFGQPWAFYNFFNQLCFCGLLTWLFMLTYPDLDNLERHWGTVTNWKEGVLYFCVLAIVVYQIIRSIVEMATIMKNNYALQREILTQKYQAQLLNCNPATEAYTQLKDRLESDVRAELKSFETIRKSFSVMVSIYFERDLPIPREFQNIECKKRAHGSITGFFIGVSLMSNLGFIVAQGAAICGGIYAARILLISIIIIMICEYLMLFLWLQTNQKVGRFLLTVVIILERDIFGFAVVFVIVQLVFTICFLVLAKEHDGMHKWFRAYFIWYELSIGSGEWFKEKVDDIEYLTEEDEDEDIDSYRRILLYITYMLYISITLVVLMNLLIAIMSETASNLTKQMALWGNNIKLSSVSLISRRLRATSSTWRFFGLRCFCLSDQKQTLTFGGQTGKQTKIIEGRLKIRKDIMRYVRLSTWIFGAERDMGPIDLVDYFNKMRYWTVLEHEALNIKRDGRKTKTEDDVTQEYARKFINQKMKEFFNEQRASRWSAKSGHYL